MNLPRTGSPPEQGSPAEPFGRLESLPIKDARAEVRRGIGSGDVVEFVQSGVLRGERAIAVADVARTKTLWGEDLGQRAIRLSADTVRTHPRFCGFDAADWLRVQRLVDGGVVVVRDSRRLLWLEDGGRPWVAVLKRTRKEENYLVSYRRGMPAR